MKPLQERFVAIIEEIKEIDLNFSDSLSDKGFEGTFFVSEEEYSVLRECNELTFIYTVAFLYKLYIERGRNNVKYLLKKYNIFNLNKNDAEMNLQDVTCFRTYFFHFLDSSLPHNKETIKKTQLWFLYQTGKDRPLTEEEWENCVLKILDDAKKFLNTLKDCLQKLIELDDDRLYNEWLTYLKKDLPKYKIRKIIVDVMSKYELSFDVDVFLEKNISKLQAKINLFDSEQIEYIENNTELLIENLIFQPGVLMCPLSGSEIENRFGVTGKELGKMKRKAIQIFEENVYLTKEDIVEALENSI